MPFINDNCVAACGHTAHPPSPTPWPPQVNQRDYVCPGLPHVIYIIPGCILHFLQSSSHHEVPKSHPIRLGAYLLFT